MRNEATRDKLYGSALDLKYSLIYGKDLNQTILVGATRAWPVAILPHLSMADKPLKTNVQNGLYSQKISNVFLE